MIGDYFVDDIVAYILFGIFVNFLFSFLFATYLGQNIGVEEMIASKGEKPQPWWMPLLLIIPFAKMLLTLYRVAILQIYFLNRGYSHKDFWIYLTHSKD